MTRLWLVRHGPTHAKAMIGWTDLPADLSGTAKIDRLRAYLPDAPIVSSDLIRAVQTADVLVGRSRLPHDPRLREINFGDWDGKSFAEAEVSDPLLLRSYWETPGDVAPPQGESWNAVRSRADAAFNDYLALGHQDLVVVAHFGVILTQVQRALKISAYDTFAYQIENLSVTQLSVKDDEWFAGGINHIP